MAAKKGTKTKKKNSATATEIRNRELAELKKRTVVRQQMRAILLFALSVLLLFMVLIPDKDGNVWNWIHNFLFGLFGVCTYVMPLLLGTVAVLGAMDKLYDRLGTRVAEAGLLVVFICTAVDLFSSTIVDEATGIELTFFKHISAAFTQKSSGGFFGALLGHPLYKAFGETGSRITIIILICVVLMFITGTTLIALFKMLSKPIKSAGSAIEHKIESLSLDSDDSKPSFAFDIPIDEEEEHDRKLEERRKKESSLEEKRRTLIESYTGKKVEEIEESGIDVEVDDTENDLEKSKEKTPRKKVVKSEPAADSTNMEKDLKSELETYRFPPLSLLSKSSAAASGGKNDINQTAEKLVNILRSFGVETRVINVSAGPSVTRYELQPAAGVKISKITNLADDIAMNLASAGVRIEAPIPNKPAVGIEVPNRNTQTVCIRDIIDTDSFRNTKSKLTVALGKDIAGVATVTDINKMPHGLIAGATGSGKSVCINSIIISLLYNASPDDVKLLMIDPKVVELGIYNGIPHLLVPVVTDPRKASGALGWAVSEMEKRYKLFAENDVRNLEGYNKLAEKSDTLVKMPQIVIIIDELADLMMTAPSEVEDSICRIAQKARAAGMHLIIATQRPSVDVITGIIKANIPTRIAFAVSSQVDSRTILDMGGADKLLGRGDMLFYPVGAVKPKRIQGCFVSDEEVEAVVEFIKGEQTGSYDENVMIEIERQAAKEKASKSGNKEDLPEDGDVMLPQAIECVVDAGMASTSLLQRKLKLGYARAARIIDEMEERGIVGPYEGSKPRQVLITKNQLLEMQARSEEITE